MADPYNMTYEAVTPQDIFDLYGAEFLLSKINDAGQIGELETRIREIHKVYLAAAKKRAEWILNQIGPRRNLTPDTLRGIVDEANQGFEAFIQSKLTSAKFNDGNLMGVFLEGYQSQGVKVEDELLQKYGVKKTVDKPRITVDVDKIGIAEWKEIARAYIELEDAATPRAMVLTIDRMNDLQHCGGNLLVDFQVGRRAGEGKNANEVKGNDVEQAVDILKDVLDLKSSAKHPSEFLDRMSREVRKIWASNRMFLT